MKKLDWLILRSFLGPLALTFTLSVFVLLMQFVWKYIDDMVGKGLDFGVIAELLLYASATFVPMALPIAILFASIMTMGNFGEKYELVAMKAGGVSVSRVMLPMTVVVLLLTGVAFYFANNVMPEAMVSYRKTLYDVTRKKPAINIRPGEYYKDIEGYVIRIGSKSPDGRTLEDVVIYDHTKGSCETAVIVAKRGTMQSTIDNRYLIFSLDDGYTYTESTTGTNLSSRPMTSLHFSHQTISFDISSFAYNKSAEDLYAEELRTIATPLNRRNKRLLDMACALVLIVLTPVLVWFQKKRKNYLPHCWQVLTGHMTWVGTDGGATRKGVFGPEDSLPHRAKAISPELKERLHLRYMRNYKLTTDLLIILNNLRNI